MGFVRRLRHGAPLVASFLLAAGLSADEALDRELFLAARTGDRAAVAALLARGASVHARGSAERTALIAAAGRGHRDVVELLLDRGADLEARDIGGGTALRAACRSSEAVLVLLLDRGASITVTDGHGDPLLPFAAELGNTWAVKHLLARGAAVDSRTRNPVWKGYTALHMAAFQGHAEAARVLIDARAEVRARVDTGQNALTLAAQHGSEELVKLFLARGVPIDETDNFNRTPLMFAALSGQVGTVKLLLDRGADPTRRDGRGESALELAHPDKRAEIARLLEAKSRRP